MSSTEAQDWFAGLLGAGQQNGINISAFEMDVSGATAVTYATLIDQWRTQYDNGNQTVTAQWEPESVILNGSKPETYGAVSIAIPYLAVGSASVLIITVTFLAALFRRKAELKEVGILQIISLMNGSRLPGIMARRLTAEEEVSRNARRVRAEGVIVRYVILHRELDKITYFPVSSDTKNTVSTP